ncbi:hypothetical protein FDC62_13870 [Clostridium botulinum]|uniref:hypothetical protein n=1 Tax=Clostridium botulinum TaxID=1491 RepID=UPI00052C0A36|nr:hypothetical protein [Clostridium botulinum]KGM95193.1 hypothetical protein Z956_05500 [Clostridium botulinum D str. CCUG 7971]NFO99231.1 hypothetical protein [Clostridium botulinum]OOV50728.1 hypothetical protein B1A66_13040 [Clostridium botulinum D/C]OOV53132.1 hypothetical protein B1A67_13795 [Clostridium botulinum D/C]OOV53134.1 hypothetical protein B0673_13975 [Clostridium botulinum D/C]
MNYIDVVNDSDSKIKFELIYHLDKQVIVDSTPDFGPKKIRRLDLPYNAIVIIFRVWVLLSNAKYKLIYDESISKSERRCYGVRGSGQSAICERIDCSILPNTDFVDVRNKTLNQIRFEIIYTIQGMGYKESSLDIKPNRGSSLLIPRTAENVQLKVFILEEKLHQDVWHPIYAEYMKHPFKFCYQVTGEFPKVDCKKVPCKNNGDNDIPTTNPTQPCPCCCCNCKCIFPTLQNQISYICKNEYEFFLNKLNVQAVGLGYKEIQGIVTNEMCIKVFVSEKTPPGNLPPSDLIPPIYNGIKTDVVESGIFTPCELTKKVRPAHPGYSIGPAGYKVAGTLGCIVQNPSEKAYYILSTNHILAQLGKVQIDTPILQPGVLDGGKVDTDTIAHLTRYIPIKMKTLFKTPENYVDAAIAKVSNTSLISSKIAIVNNNIKRLGAPAIADRVFKIGRTTERTYGVITAIDVTQVINYPEGKALFKEQILTSTRGNTGDSGSILLNPNMEALGLLSSASKDFTTFSDMTLITSLLHVQLVTH